MVRTKKGPKANQGPLGREKITTTLSRAARHKLTVLRADLRLKGVPVSEGEILDALLEHAEADSLTRLFRSTR